MSRKLYRRKFDNWKVNHKKRYLHIRQQLFQEVEGICPICHTLMDGGVYNTNGEIPTPKNLATIDHIIPLRQGGKHNRVSNMRIICFSCNSALGGQQGAPYDPTYKVKKEDQVHIVTKEQPTKKVEPERTWFQTILKEFFL